MWDVSSLQYVYGPCYGQDVGKVGVTIVVRNSPITDLDFTDDAVIFANTTGVLSKAFESLREEAEPLN